MSIKSKREALASIVRRSRCVHGKKYTLFDVYLGTNDLTKKAERLYANTEGKLKSLIEDFYDARRETGDLSTVLTVDQIFDAKTAFRILADADKTITLTDCAKLMAERIRSSHANPMKICDAYAEFLAEKPEGHDKRKTVSTTGRFVLCVDPTRTVASFTAKEIESFLKTNYGSNPPKTYNSYFSYISTFFNWCANPKRRYAPENVMLVLDKKAEPWKEPEYLSVENARRLFAALESEKEAHPDVLALAVTSFFTGTRREEILRMSSLDDAVRVHLDDETVRIAKGKGYQRGIAPRSFQILPNALAWMRSFDYLASIKKVNEGTTARLADIAREHKIPIFRNCGRHSFITYHVAAFGDPAKTQAMVGTSAKMRADHYCGLASKKDGEAFFAIYPSATPEASGSAPSA